MVGKECYPKYCVACPFLVKAEWSPKEGFKYGWLDVYCCANGGKWIDDGQTICPQGIGWGFRLGTTFEFDPKYCYPLHELEEMYKFNWININEKEDRIGLKTHD